MFLEDALSFFLCEFCVGCEVERVVESSTPLEWVWILLARWVAYISRPEGLRSFVGRSQFPALSAQARKSRAKAKTNSVKPKSAWEVPGKKRKARSALRLVPSARDAPPHH